jgi:hypothetical protein
MPRQNLADLSAMRRTTVNKLEFREARSRENHVPSLSHKLGNTPIMTGSLAFDLCGQGYFLFAIYILTGANDTAGKFTLASLQPVSMTDGGQIAASVIDTVGAP